MDNEKIIKAYNKLYDSPISYNEPYEKRVYRNALKDLMNELKLL